jgi:hypothetical protein
VETESIKARFVGELGFMIRGRIYFSGCYPLIILSLPLTIYMACSSFTIQESFSITPDSIISFSGRVHHQLNGNDARFLFSNQGTEFSYRTVLGQV